MKLIFEKSSAGHGTDYLPKCDVEPYSFPAELCREHPLVLPETEEAAVSRHYTELARQVYGVNDGFYPLGSCTMKYNPKINEELAGLEGFAEIHPLQPVETVQGCLETMYTAQQYFCEITGMDGMSLQPAAGAQGEFAGLLMIKAYHLSRGDMKRIKIIIPDSAHGTNPASCAMAGFEVVNIKSNAKGCVDMKTLKNLADDTVAGMMLTNPNTVGIFEENILEITQIIHNAGGLLYYDGANLNAIAGVVRPGDMGFDVIHLNLHKTFSAPHGGGGPGAGPVGCKEPLLPFLPAPVVKAASEGFDWAEPSQSVGRIKMFYGHFPVIVKALTYVLTLGAEGIREMSETAVLNANYLKNLLKECFDTAYEGYCMHEFVLTLEKLKKEKGVSALDIAKALLDEHMHPPTMYFPLIVSEALMLEPTETESKTDIEEAAKKLTAVYRKAKEQPEMFHDLPLTTPVCRPDEAVAARNPVLRYFSRIER